MSVAQTGEVTIVIITGHFGCLYHRSLSHFQHGGHILRFYIGCMSISHRDIYNHCYYLPTHFAFCFLSSLLTYLDSRARTASWCHYLQLVPSLNQRTHTGTNTSAGNCQSINVNGFHNPDNVKISFHSFPTYCNSNTETFLKYG